MRDRVRYKINCEKIDLHQIDRKPKQWLINNVKQEAMALISTAFL